MDTKLKKMRNTKVLIILLTILIPAIVLVAFYPRMGKMYTKRLNQITGEVTAEEVKETATDEAEYYLDSSFVNYAMEASYYLYGQMLQEESKKAVDFSVLDQYGWINDYYELSSACDYYVTSKSGSQFGLSVNNTMNYDLSILLGEDGDANKRDLENKLDYKEGYLGYLVLEFDQYGNLSNVKLQNFGNIDSKVSLYPDAQKSIRQYEDNVFFYNDSMDQGEVDEMELRPKDFHAVFLIGDENPWLGETITDYAIYSYDPLSVYLEMGTEWLVVAMGVLIILVALILPFFKKLNTGWEKLFSLPAEIIFCIGLCAIGGFVLMFELMVFSSYPILTETISLHYGNLNFIGYTITPNMVYYIMLGVNVIGWAFVFFLEYITVAAFRQFLCGPLRYLKDRLLLVMFCRFLWKECKKFYHYITDIKIGQELHKSILKVVLANFVVVAACCCFWFVGWFGVVLYSVLLYLVLRKQGEKIQAQYTTVVDAAKQMAEGNLKSELPDEPGIFTELGTELKKVQDGFAKAVAEEAKSQNMKTELITNVSHDLKTPLTAIITYVDLLKKEDITEEERKEYIDTLDRKSQRLKTLIEDLFEVSKASSNNIVMDYSDVDLVNLLKQVYLENEDRIKESTLQVRMMMPEKKCMAHLDPNRTYRIMDNLLQNALKYSMPHSRVYVELEEKETEYRICFKNMSAVEMNFDAREITERFVRGDLSRNTEGSGLGLAIAQSFTELQSGKFNVEIDGDLFKVVLKFEKISSN